MVRPTYLLVEAPNGGISPRKLVIEAVNRHNVLLADTCAEAEQTLRRFPEIDAVIIHVELAGYRACVDRIRREHPDVVIVVLGEESRIRRDESANLVVSGYDPIKLLESLTEHYASDDQVRRRAGPDNIRALAG